FYRSGTGSFASLPLHAGWVARSGSFADRMPVWNETRDIGLIFAGENFVDSAVVSDLRQRGHTFNPDGPEYLVHLYEEQGPKFFGQLNGWFAGVIIDLRSRQVVLFNDRYGLNRVYLAEDSSGFYFASEAK